MAFTMEQYRESARAIQSRLGGFVPRVAMSLGSGLGELAFRPLVHSGGRTQRCAFPVLAGYRCGRQREATCLTVL